jgi:hypothetical protein
MNHKHRVRSYPVFVVHLRGRLPQGIRINDDDLAFFLQDQPLPPERAERFVQAFARRADETCEIALRQRDVDAHTFRLDHTVFLGQFQQSGRRSFFAPLSRRPRAARGRE